ncbi:MAG: hypothetical protein RRZ68_03785 [Oscillospiraceae bacterium]
MQKKIEIDTNKQTYHTIDEVINLSYDQLNTFIDDFKENNDELTNYRSSTYIENSYISPLWSSSGGTSLDNDSSHAFLTAQAVNCLMNDKGFWRYNTDGMNDLLVLMVMSEQPDTTETDAKTMLGHFYNPNTQKNYLGLSAPTALDRAADHYYAAVNYEKAGDHSNAMNELGLSLHYYQDVFSPHHTASAPKSQIKHLDFENYSASNIESYFETPVGVTPTQYNYAYTELQVEY